VTDDAGSPDLTAPDLSALLAEAGLSVPSEAVDRLLEHAREMLRWNRAIRLTAITAPAEVAVKHIVDSLLLLRLAPFPGRTLDFGSGAGYPGIPLAIALPEARIVLLESAGKKSAFLSHVRARLGLRNVEVLHARLEKKKALPLQPFEGIVTRATLPPRAAAALLVPYLAPGGRLLLMTGPGEDAVEGGATVLPPGVRERRRLRFALPRGMGLREIREVVAGDGPGETRDGPEGWHSSTTTGPSSHDGGR
jgi:16S rRNA (guanine527-N7)-methyltransferase